MIRSWALILRSIEMDGARVRLFSGYVSKDQSMPTTLRHHVARRFAHGIAMTAKIAT